MVSEGTTVIIPILQMKLRLTERGDKLKLIRISSMLLFFFYIINLDFTMLFIPTKGKL